jgi:hypothetical protein
VNAQQVKPREQADGARDTAKEDSRQAVADTGGVEIPDVREPEEHGESEETGAEFEAGVDPQGMFAGGDQAGQGSAAEAHASHERSEQDGKRGGGRPDHQLQQLQPDDLIDQGGTPAPDEKSE